MQLRLLHAIQTVNPSAGGPVEGLRQLGVDTERLGHVTEVVTLDSPDAPWVNTMGVKVHAIGTGHALFGFSKRYLDWLVEHAPEYDCIIVDGIWGFNALATWLALKHLWRKQRHAAKEQWVPPYVVFPYGMVDPLL